MAKNTKRQEGLKQLTGSYATQAKAAKSTAEGVVTSVNAAKKLVQLDPVGAIKDAAKGTKQIVKGVVDSFKGVGEWFIGLGKTLFNHKEWYDVPGVKEMVNLNYGRRRGITEEGMTAGGSTGNQVYALPSVMRIALDLSIPNTAAASYKNSINIMYNRIRQANAGAINYTPAQLENYVNAVRHLHGAYYNLRRAYATLGMYNKYDSELPYAFLAAMGFDYDTFAANAASIKQYLSIWNNQLRELSPLTLPILDRTDWLFSNIFADSNDKKASYYIFSQQEVNSYYQNGTAIALREVQFASDAVTSGLSSTTTGQTWSYIQGVIDQMREDFNSVNVFQIIAGDILRAYGESVLFPIHSWGVNEQTPVIYDEAALTQIQNATSFGNGITVAVQNAIGADGFTESNVALTRSAMQGALLPSNAIIPMLNRPFVNMYKDSIDGLDTISATRLKLALRDGITSWAAATTITANDLYFGTEIVLRSKVITISSGSNNAYKLNDTTTIGIAIATAANDTPYNEMTFWSSFDYAPMEIFHSYNDQEITGLLFDFNNYARASSMDISSFHEYACAGLYDIERRLKATSNIKL